MVGAAVAAAAGSAAPAGHGWLMVGAAAAPAGHEWLMVDTAAAAAAALDFGAFFPSRLRVFVLSGTGKGSTQSSGSS